MNRKESIERIGINVDRLITTDVNGRGMINKLYPIALEMHKRPLTLVSAEKILEKTKDGDFVFIITGLTIPDILLPETDGPPGSAALARALDVGLKAKTVFVINEPFVDVMNATARGAGLNVIPLERLKEVKRGVSVTSLPVEDDKAEEAASKLISEFQPKAMISIEMRGPNEKGVYHSVLGIDMSQYEGKVDHLFTKAKEKVILTMGIGDGCGHEIGFGSLKEQLKQIEPWHEVMQLWWKCLCPCGAGIIDNTDVDVFISAAVSNWGAYGTAACLSALLEKKEVLHNREVEFRMLRRCADEGAVDGIFNVPQPTVDGISGDVNASIVQILHEIVEGGLKKWNP